MIFHLKKIKSSSMFNFFIAFVFDVQRVELRQEGSNFWLRSGRQDGIMIIWLKIEILS